VNWKEDGRTQLWPNHKCSQFLRVLGRVERSNTKAVRWPVSGHHSAYTEGVLITWQHLCYWNETRNVDGVEENRIEGNCSAGSLGQVHGLWRNE
jgi:hypothetical protein